MRYSHKLLGLIAVAGLWMPAVGLVASQHAYAQLEEPATTPQTFQGQLDQNSQIIPQDGSYYNAHTFEGETGQIVQIDMESHEFDTFLWLLAPDGSILAQNDDFAETNSRIVIVLPTTGTYTLWANSYTRDVTGSYTLSIQPTVHTVDTEFANRLAEADLLFQQGTQQAQTGQLDEALQNLQRALEIYQEPAIQSAFPQHSRQLEGLSLNNLGNVYYQLFGYARSIEFYVQALTIARETRDRQGEFNALDNLGNAYFGLGQYRQAIDFNEQSLVIAQEIDDRRGEASALNNLGNAYFGLDEYSQAIDFYEQSLVIAQEIGDRRGEALTLNNLGNSYDYQGQYSQAIGFYEQSAILAQKIGDRQAEGLALNNLGNTYQQLGQYQQSITFYEKAFTIAQEISDLQGESNALGNLGNTYRILGQYQQAVSFYEQQLAIVRDINDFKGESNALGNLGVAFGGQGDYQRAIDLYEQALVIQREMGDEEGEGNSLGNIGIAYAEMGQYLRALENMQQALAIAQQINDRAGEASRFNNIGFTLEDIGQPELAIVFLKQSINEWEDVRGNIRSLDSELQQSFIDRISVSYRLLAELLLQQDRVLEAQEVLDLLKLQELDDYQLRDVRGTEETREGLSFWQAEQEILNLFNEYLQVENEQNFQAFIDRPEIQDLVSQLQRNARGQNLNPEQLARLQDNLQQAGNAALLYPLILDDRLELVLVTTDGLVRRTVPVSRVELNRVIADFRSDITNRFSDPIPNAQQLYDWLIAPLADDMDAAGAETVLYAADGALRYIPLAALHDGEQWLTQRYIVNHITAASLMDFSQAGATTLNILAGAFPEHDLPVQIGQEQVRFSGLPYAQVEVRTLSENLPNTQAFFSADFNREEIEPRLDQHTVLHLATHGQFRSGHPNDSFILLGDGDRITLFDLDQWDLPNVDLVVLSACETAVSGPELGSGEEILGFGYQVQRTGARAAISSLWSVSDGGTQILMNSFYGAVQEGLPKAAALQAAQEALITGDFTAVGGWRADVEIRSAQGSGAGDLLTHPYYWAPFILIGNGL